MGGDDRLGQLGGAGGEEELGDGVGPGGGKRRIGWRKVARLQQAVEAQVPAAGGLAAHAHHRHRWVQHGVEGTLERLGVGGEHQTRRQYLAHMPQLGKVLGQQCVGRRHRAVRDAGVHGAQGDLQVLDIVAGKKRQRPLGAQAKAQQVGGDGTYLHEHLRVGDCAPGTVGLTRGNEGGVRALCGPVQQPVKQARRQRRQGLDGLHAQDAVGLAELHLGMPDGHLPVARALTRGGRPCAGLVIHAGCSLLLLYSLPPPGGAGGGRWCALPRWGNAWGHAGG
ncbi:hypothetical protein D3C79_774150 [compost metagenome]